MRCCCSAGSRSAKSSGYSSSSAPSSSSSVCSSVSILVVFQYPVLRLFMFVCIPAQALQQNPRYIRHVSCSVKNAQPSHRRANETYIGTKDIDMQVGNHANTNKANKGNTEHTRLIPRDRFHRPTPLPTRGDTAWNMRSRNVSENGSTNL